MILTTNSHIASVLELVSTQARSKEQGVVTCSEVNTGVAESKIAKKPAEFLALLESRQAGTGGM